MRTSTLVGRLDTTLTFIGILNPLFLTTDKLPEAVPSLVRICIFNFFVFHF